jgi:GH24 family phage-related lysozyme (muramidase)
MDFTFQGVNMDFRDIFYTYAVDREGYRTVVYADIKGYPTVGVGHLVTAADGLSIGDVITDEQVLNLFYDDYAAMNIDSYVEEGADNYNQGLAIAHFIWGHGAADYDSSQLRQHIINGDLDLNGMINYLNSNWDLSSPSNQKVNNYDFTVYYSDTPWQPSKSLAYYFSQIKNIVQEHPITSLVIAGSVGLALSVYLAIVIKKIIKKGK